VRVVPCLGLIALCLGLAGCSTFGKKANPPPRAPAEAPFAPKAPGAAAVPPPDPLLTAPAASGGILAGQIIDSYNRQPDVTYIQVTATTERGEPAGAPIEVRADHGYFTIPGLQPGRHYQLTARVQDGSRVLAGSTWATPPNPKVLIRISEDFASATTPPLPGPPVWQGGAPAPEKPAPPAPAWPQGPTATKDQPIGPAGSGVVPPSRAAELRPPTGLKETPAGPAPAGPTPSTSIQAPAPTRWDKVANDDRVAKNVSPRIDIKSPAAPAGEWKPAGLSVPAGPAVADQPPGAGGPAPVPSCVLTGYQLHNFALRDLNGQPWEFKSHRGRLVLLDFWGSWCVPCLYAIPHLKILQERYAAYGLEVIGIDYERGSPQEQVIKANRIRALQGITYRILLGTDSPDELARCPVRAQFGVNSWPTLVLVDENNRIIWRGEGLDASKLQELEIIIKQRLGVR
jgi:thiol-disulfide isomerase/thioredoxin